MNSTSNPNQTMSLEELVPYVVDVIEHAVKLQEQAENSVKRVEGATAALVSAARDLKATQAQMAADIENGVGRKFDDAINGASGRIGQQLASAEAQSQKALRDLTASAGAAVQAIQDEAARLKSNLWWPVLLGGIAGLLIGSLSVYLWMSR